MKELTDILHHEHCSLIVRDREGNVHRYFKKGVRDLEDILRHEPSLLRGALIADKVIGKAAAGMVCYGGVAGIYAEVLSKKALPLLEASNVFYLYDKLVDQIIIPKGSDRCPLEKIVEPASNAEEVVTMLFRHFEEKEKEAISKQAE